MQRVLATAGGCSAQLHKAQKLPAFVRWRVSMTRDDMM
jgi:hypothetical protein